MNQSGRVDYDQVARAQALLLDRHRLSPEALVAAYRMVRTEKPNAYIEPFVEALISTGRTQKGEPQIPALIEAVEIAREATAADIRYAKVLIKALTAYQRGLCDTGRRAEAVEACREMALVGERAFERGVVPGRTFGSRQLACRLAEDGEHAEAAALFGAIVRDNETPESPKDFWDWIAWIAEMEAAGQGTSARDALQELIDEDRRRADRHARAYAIVVWERLLMASMDRRHGRDADAEHCDEETEGILVMLAADGEPKNWSNILDFWAVLIGLTRGSGEARPAQYLGEGRDRLLSERSRIAELAEHEPSLHLGELVEVQRQVTIRSLKQLSWRITDDFRCSFDEGVRLARRLVDVDEQRGRPALARALTDRTSMHVAARDFPPALSDFQQARRVAAGGLLG